MALVVKNLPIMQKTQMWVWSLVGNISWRMAWPPTPVFLPGESHGQSLVGVVKSGAPWGCKELDITEALSTQLYQLFFLMVLSYRLMSLHFTLKDFSYWLLVTSSFCFCFSGNDSAVLWYPGGIGSMTSMGTKNLWMLVLYIKWHSVCI